MHALRHLELRAVTSRNIAANKHLANSTPLMLCRSVDEWRETVTDSEHFGNRTATFGGADEGLTSWELWVSRR
jgi:hypothetical protein